MAEAISKEKTTKVVKVKGTQQIIDAVTGECMDVEVIQMKNSDFNFSKIWLGHIIQALDAVGNQKIRVITFILDNMQNNMLIMSQTKIAKFSKVSKPIVNETLQLLYEVDFLTRQADGVYVVNPDVIFKGSHNKRMNVLFQYEKAYEESTKKDRPDLRLV